MRSLVRIAACLMAWTLASSAHADEYPACDKKPSTDDVEAAKGMHRAAEQYYAKARYDRAISSWQDAYSFDCTAHRLLINIGNAYEKMGQTERAIAAFEAYIARTGQDADQNVIDKVANLKELLRSHSEVPVPTPDPTPEPLPSPDPVPDDAESDLGPGPWILIGVGGAAAIAGAVMLGVGVANENEAAGQCPTRMCTQDITDLGNQGLALQIAGGTVLGVGLAAAAGGLVWYLVGTLGGADSSSLPARVDVAVSPGFTGLAIDGTF